MKLLKIGAEKILATDGYKTMLSQLFQNPNTKETHTRTLFRGGKISSIVFPLTHDGFVVSVEQFRHGSNRIITELPGGNIEQDESPQEAGKRELEEETGYSAEKVVLLAEKIFYEPCSFENFFCPVLALNCKKKYLPKMDSDENLKIKLVPLKEWMRKTQKGKIIDGKSIITTHLALSYL